MPAIRSYFIEPIWEQFSALRPEREVDHPLGCHHPRIPDRVVFEKLVEVLVFGCAYWRIDDESCSNTTLRRRRDEWINMGVMDALRETVLDAYDRIIGLELANVAMGWCVTKAPCGGDEVLGRGAHELVAQRPQEEAGVVHGAPEPGHRILGRLLRRGDRREKTHPGSLEPLPLGGSTLSSTVTY